MKLYGHLEPGGARAIIEERIAEESKILNTARVSAAEAFDRARTRNAINGSGAFHEHRSPASPREIRADVSRTLHRIRELVLMRDAVAFPDPAAGLRRFADQTTSELLAADARELADALSDTAA